MASRVYSYGTVPPRVAPVQGEEGAIAQLRLANRLWNVLVAIERTRMERYHKIMRNESQERIEELKIQIGALRDEIKARRQKVRSKSAPADDCKDAIEQARAEMHALIESQRSTAAARHDGRRAELNALSERTKHRIKRARQASASMGLFWGTYNDIVGRADTGRKSGEIQFRRFNATGTLTAQIIGGATAEQCIEGDHTFFQVERSANRWRYASIRIGSSADRMPVWLKIPIVMHRDIPAGALIKSVSATRRRDGSRRPVWQLNITVTLPDAQPRQPARAVAIDIGWRLLPDCVRVGYWADSDRREGAVTVPCSSLRQFEQVRELRSHCDLLHNEFLPACAAWMSGQALEGEWAARTKALAQWRSSDRLADLVRWWSDHRIPGDEEMYTAAAEWREHYLHLANWWRNLQGQLRLRIREDYRVFAAGLARRYSLVIFEEFDLREVLERPEPESDAVMTAANYYRVCVSPATLRDAVRNACEREGVRLLRVPSPDTTCRCHACGRIEEWDQAAELLHRCSCGVLWDQDANAAMNLLRDGLASAAAAPTEDQQVRVRKWDRVRDRSRKALEGPQDQIDAG